MKRPKSFAYDGPPIHIQRLRLKPKRTRQENKEIRQWVNGFKKRTNPRPETIEAYTV